MKSGFFVTLFVLICTITACGLKQPGEPQVGATLLLADNARYPAIAADGHGNMVAVWAAAPDFKASFYRKGSGWTVPQAIGTLAPGWSDLKLACNSNGDVLVVWLRSDPNPANIHVEAVKFTAATGWGAPVNIGAIGTPKAAAINDSGEAWVVAGTNPAPFARVAAVRYVPATGWGAPDFLDDNTDSTSDPMLALDEAGRATVLWGAGVGPDSLVARQFVPGSGWSPRQTVVSNSGIGDKAFAGKKSGEAAVVWTQFDGQLQVLYSSFFVPGTGWSSPVRVSSPTSDVRNPALAADSSGNYMAAWTEIAQASAPVSSSRYAPGTGWSAPVQIGAGGNAAKPQVGMDDQGGACAAWYQSEPADPYTVYSNRFNAGTGWETQRKIKTDSGAVDEVRLAVSSEGAAVAIWSQSNGSLGIGSPKYGVYANRVR